MYVLQRGSGISARLGLCVRGPMHDMCCVCYMRSIRWLVVAKDQCASVQQCFASLRYGFSVRPLG